MIRSSGSIAVSGLLLVCGAVVAGEESNVWMEVDRSSFHLGTYLADFDTSVRLSSDLGRGTDVSVEDDFGLDDSNTSVFLHFDYRLTPKHRLDFAYYDLSRDGSAQVERDIEFGDISIPVGANVDTEFDYRIGKLTYSYALIQNQQIDFAAAAGVYLADFDIRTVNLDNGDADGEDSLVPVPLIGLRAAYMFSPRFIANAYVEYLTYDSGDSDATYLDTTLSLEYRLRDHFGAGLAYNLVNIDGEDKSSDDEGDFEYRGLLLFVLYNFD